MMHGGGLMKTGRVVMGGYEILAFVSGGDTGACARVVSCHHGGGLLTSLGTWWGYCVGYGSVWVGWEAGVGPHWWIAGVGVRMVGMHCGEQRVMH